MKPFRLRTMASVLAGSVFVTSSFAHAEDDVTQLKQQVEELDQKIRVIQRLQEIDKEAAAGKAKETATVSASPEGFSIKSTDNAFQLKLRGLLHADGRWFTEGKDATTNDTFLLRRVRPILEGTVFGNYDFRFTPDFGGGRTVIQDAYVDARFLPWFQVKGGKFKTPFGIERLQSAKDIRFIERALPNNLVPNRDIGLELHGDYGSGLVSWSFAYLNGVNDGRSSEDFGDVDNNPDKDYAGRIFAHPFLNSDIVPLQGLGVGVAVSYVQSDGSAASPNLPSYQSTGQQRFFTYRSNTTSTSTDATFADGERLRISPQIYYYYGPFGLLGEYVTVSQDVRRNISATNVRRDSLDHDAWQVAASYVLTGEESTYKGVKPKRPFSVIGGGWGAFELAVRYSEFNVDIDTFVGDANSFANPTTAAQQAKAYGVGVNWYLNNNVKFVVDYEKTLFEGGGGGTVAPPLDRPDEGVVQSRIQLAF